MTEHVTGRQTCLISYLLKRDADHNRESVCGDTRLQFWDVWDAQAGLQGTARQHRWLSSSCNRNVSPVEHLCVDRCMAV